MKYFVVSITLLVFIGVAGFGFLSIQHTHHHQETCPFMVGEQGLCLMDIIDHLLLWKHLFTGILSATILFLFAHVLAWYDLVSPRHQILRKGRPPSSDLSLFVLLFKKGILNPKAP